MTEAVFLALIALMGTTVFMLLLIALVNIVLSANPTKVFAHTAYGQFGAEFDHKADE